MDEAQVKFLLQFIATGTKVLAVRLAMFIAMLITAGLFGWSMWQPDNLRTITATIFAALVFLPVLRQDSKNKEIQQ